MATSTIPTCKTNLQAQLQARGGLSTVQISYGPPSVGMEREYIWIGDVEGEQTYATFNSPNAHHELYDIQLIVDVILEGTSEAAADARCFAIFAEIENQLRTDPTINSAVSESHINRFKLTENVTSDGMTRTARLVVLVHCQAYI